MHDHSSLDSGVVAFPRGSSSVGRNRITTHVAYLTLHETRSKDVRGLVDETAFSGNAYGCQGVIPRDHPAG
jgi:hypothetical protein